MQENEDIKQIRLRRAAKRFPISSLQQKKPAFVWSLMREQSDEQFIEGIYLRLLGRYPESQAKYQHIKNLKSHSQDRIDIVFDLRKSPEGINANAPIYGITAYRYLTKIKKRILKR